MKTMATILGLALVALVGCDGSSESSGFDVNPPGDMRGDVDAGGASGAAGVSGAGGAAGAAGSVGGHVGAGGSGAGGAVTGAGGSIAGSVGGAGGGSNYPACSSPTAGGGVCERTSPINGGTLLGSKDGMICMLLVNPITGAAAGPSECTVPTSDPREFLVAVKSCAECTFQ